MNKKTLVVGLAVILAGATSWVWYQSRDAGRSGTQAPPAERSGVVQDAPLPPVAEEQLPEEPRFPLEPPASAPDAPTLPPMADSDRPLLQDIVRLAGESTVLEWLVPDTMVRRFVATVDNLPRTHVAERSRLLRGAHDTPVVERTVLDAASGEERIVLSDANFARYDGAIAALQALDMQQVAAVYRHWYPLLQQSYEDLGYPGRHFNDRVVAVIDHLLEAPEVAGPIELVQPKVLYEYADASLEARSAGQKLLVRMGPAHARVVKEQLRRLRAAITGTADDRE